MLDRTETVETTTPVADAAEQEQRSFASAPIPGLAYVGLSKKSEFDALALPAHVHEWTLCKTTTLIRSFDGDARTWERRCTSKMIEDGPVRVVFQWFDYRAVEVAA